MAKTMTDPADTKPADTKPTDTKLTDTNAPPPVAEAGDQGNQSNPQKVMEQEKKPVELDPEQAKVEREREIMRDPHEKDAEKNKRSANAPRPMPSYRHTSGAVVAALRIKDIRPVGGKSTDSELHFHEEGYGPVRVNAPWITANHPRVGGWYVVDVSGRRFLNAQDFALRYHRGAAA